EALGGIVGGRFQPAVIIEEHLAFAALDEQFSVVGADQGVTQDGAGAVGIDAGGVQERGGRRVGVHANQDRERGRPRHLHLLRRLRLGSGRRRRRPSPPQDHPRTVMTEISRLNSTSASIVVVLGLFYFA